jgi:hypothetical protein
MAGKGSPKGVKQGGRKKGTPNRLTKELKDCILEALHQAEGIAGEADKKTPTGAVAYLKRQSEQNPVAFMTLIGKVLPLQVTGKDGGGLIVEVVKFE